MRELPDPSCWIKSLEIAVAEVGGGGGVLVGGCWRETLGRARTQGTERSLWEDSS